MIRNSILGFLYRTLAKPIFFSRDPEEVHDHMLRFGSFLGRYPITRSICSLLFDYSHPSLEQTILGVHFSNPVGLAAGFDKDAQLTDIVPSVGFGFSEVGSITGESCKGNAKPRLWRLKKSKGLMVYYGLKNDGCEEIAARLSKKKFRIPIGISVAKTNCQKTADVGAGIEDYVKAFQIMEPIGDYITVNISCPNAFGGEPFTDPERLNKLFTRLDSIPTQKPIFIKLSPELSEKEIDLVLECITRHRVHGIICTNLGKTRSNPALIDVDIPEKGGYGGRPAQKRSNELIAYVYKKTKGKYVIIGCGGVFTAQDAYTKIRLGASLIQMITGMIYQGPQVIGEINCGLVQLLKKDELDNISDAVGVDSR
ncbi:MAG: quinone-dependent dihydroorotate dehydrogenase [Candidatus Uhrbacteria bacterium]|nr:quinone-dependent dihydroorotate dehydrogenase [Candidatus Uhrbacteria bacterium]